MPGLGLDTGLAVAVGLADEVAVGVGVVAVVGAAVAVVVTTAVGIIVGVILTVGASVVVGTAVELAVGAAVGMTVGVATEVGGLTTGPPFPPPHPATASNTTAARAKSVRLIGCELYCLRQVPAAARFSCDSRNRSSVPPLSITNARGHPVPVG